MNLEEIAICLPGVHWSKEKRSIDMKAIIGNYELTVFPKILLSSYGSLLDESKSKSDALTEILKAAEIEPTSNQAIPCCVWCDESSEWNEYKDWTKFVKRISSPNWCHLFKRWTSNYCIWHLQWNIFTERQNQNIMQKAFNSSTWSQCYFGNKHRKCRHVGITWQQ